MDHLCYMTTGYQPTNPVLNVCDDSFTITILFSISLFLIVNNGHIGQFPSSWSCGLLLLLFVGVVVLGLVVAVALYSFWRQSAGLWRLY